MSDETLIKIWAIVILGLVIIAAIIGQTVVAVLTDRDLTKPEVLTFISVVLLTVLGGLSWYSLHRLHRWRVTLQKNGNGHTDASE